MIKVSYYLAEKQDRLLKTEAKETGMTISELIRRAIDYYFENKKS